MGREIDSMIDAINMDALTLFDAIHEARGDTDDSAYEKKVCDLYEEKIKECVKSLKVDFCIVSIEKREQIDIALKNIKKIGELIDAVNEAFERKLDFRLFTDRLTGKKGIGTEELWLWLDQTISKISTLPEAEMIYGSGFKRRPLFVLRTEPDGYSLKDFVIEKYTSFINDFARNGIDRSPGKLLTSIDSARNPYKNAGILESTRAELERLGVNVPMYGMTSVDEAIKTIVEEISRVKNEARRIAMREINRKRTSFWIGFAVWFAIMLTAVILTFILKLRVIPAHQYNGNGFWANFGILVLYIVILIILCALTMSMYQNEISIYSDGGFSKVFTWAPIFPRGLCTMLLIYWVFVSDFAKEVGKYRIPFYVLGVICIICTLIFELYDVMGHEFEINQTFVQKYDSNHRGLVMYSPLLTGVPLLVLFMFTNAFLYLHIVSIWFLAIAAFGFLGTLVFFSYYGDYMDSPCYYWF